MANPETIAPLTASPNITGLDVKLLLPLQLHPTGTLARARRSKTKGANGWLNEYAIYLAKDATWTTVADPFDSDFGRSKSGDGLNANQYAEFVYFHPFIQRILYSKQAEHRGMVLLERNDVTGLDVNMGPGFETHFRVDRLQAFLFPTDLAVIAVHLTLPGTGMSFADTLSLLNAVRRVYPPYFKDGNAADPGQSPHYAAWTLKDGRMLEGSYQKQSELFDVVAKERRPPLVAHWNELLKPLEPANEHLVNSPWESETKSPGLFFSQLGDERAYTMACVSVDRPEHVSPADHFRFAYLDEGGAGWPYAQPFLETRAADAFYDRFWSPEKGWNTRYTASGYSFTMLGDGSGFFKNVLSHHFERHYFLMNLLAVVQKSSLLVMWDRLSRNQWQYANADESHRSKRKFRDLHNWFAEDFAEYSATFEFSEVSGQVQGIELFSLIRDKMGSVKMYREVKEQFEFARNVQLANLEEQETAYQRRFTILASVAVPVSIALAFLGVATFDEAFYRPPAGPVLDWGQNWDLLGANAVRFVVMLVLSGLLCGFLYWCVKSLFDKRSKH